MLDRKSRKHSAKSPAKALSSSRHFVHSAKQQAYWPRDPPAVQEAPLREDSEASQKREVIVWKIPSTPSTDSYPGVSFLPRATRPRPFQPLPALDGYYADCDGVSRAYVLRALASIGPRLLTVVNRYTFSLKLPVDDFPNNIPPQADLCILEEDLPYIPTHYFAVYSPPESTDPDLPDEQKASLEADEQRARLEGGERSIILYAVHDIVFISHCARLPALPTPKRTLMGERVPTDKWPETTWYRIPVVPVLAKDDFFYQVLCYLYDLHQDTLLDWLVPGFDPRPPPRPPVNEPFADVPSRKQVPRAERVAHFTKTILRHFMGDVGALVGNMARIKSAWQNGVQLEIHDEGFWDMVGLAWEANLAAIKEHADLYNHHFADRNEATDVPIGQ